MTPRCTEEIAIIVPERRTGNSVEFVLQCIRSDEHHGRCGHQGKMLGTTMRGGYYVGGVGVTVDWPEVHEALSPSVLDAMQGEWDDD